MRIVSLLPACTEWLAAFGGVGHLVGRSHACDYPPEVTELPCLTQPAARAADSKAIDEEIRRHIQEGLSPFSVDLDRLVELRPDVILSQTQCQVCAVSETQLLDGISTLFEPPPRLFSMDAATMKDVLSQALVLGRVADRTGAAMQTIAECEKHLHLLRDRIGLQRTTPLSALPSVAVLEWLEPPMTAGHWIPDLIEMAGGRPVCATGGSRSKELDWKDLLREDPDVIVLAPCGLDLQAARRDVHYLRRRHGWNQLRAVRDRRVFLVDGNAYLNRPGPRLYRSIELLAAAIHRERARIDVGAREMMRLSAGHMRLEDG